ncbi:hypothetical protein ACQEV4_23530 [Streptomyces shenzhenensis]|uniref:hypothetical protein n=1 Tax=Streptomyces shenzhenensis TaxID=943815 RepID=UPI003D8D5417
MNGTRVTPARATASRAGTAASVVRSRRPVGTAAPALLGTWYAGLTLCAADAVAALPAAWAACPDCSGR